MAEAEAEAEKSIKRKLLKNIESVWSGLFFLYDCVGFERKFIDCSGKHELNQNLC